MTCPGKNVATLKPTRLGITNGSNSCCLVMGRPCSSMWTVSLTGVVVRLFMLPFAGPVLLRFVVRELFIALREAPIAMPKRRIIMYSNLITDDILAIFNCEGVILNACTTCTVPVVLKDRTHQDVVM